MLYKLLNWLFGWDYILWSNSVDCGVAKVRIDEFDGSIFYWKYVTSLTTVDITDANDVKWLTCKSSKYIGLCV